VNIEKITNKIEKKIKKQSLAREEFDSFMVKWIDKHDLPKEVYRGISFLMSSYVMNYIED
jgi:hypothetical protein